MKYLKTRAQQGKISAKPLGKRILDHWQYYVFLAPALIFVLIFCYAPMYGVTVAFKNYSPMRGITGSAWVSFENFVKLFNLSKFWQVFKNTIVLNFIRLIFDFPAPIVLALMLNEVRCHWFQRITQTVVYLPHFMSWVVIAGIMFNILSTDGVINTIISHFGGTPVKFLANPDTFRPLVVISQIWKEAGWGTIIYLAALINISPEFYEAAMIDGASRIKQLIYITIPCILPTISIMLILRMGQIMNSGFDQMFNLLNPSVYDVGDVIDTYVYRIGIVDGRFSMASAVSLFLNIINCAMLVAGDTISKKISGSGLY